MSQILPRKKITLCDVFIMVAVAALAVLSVILFSLVGRENAYAVVKTDVGSFTIPLDSDSTHAFSSNGFTYTAEVKDGEIYIVDADCPDGICKNTRAIGKRGGSIICVPGKMIVTCETEETQNADVVVP